MQYREKVDNTTYFPPYCWLLRLDFVRSAFLFLVYSFWISSYPISYDSIHSVIRSFPISIPPFALATTSTSTNDNLIFYRNYYHQHQLLRWQRRRIWWYSIAMTTASVQKSGKERIRRTSSTTVALFK